ncbi:MAG: nitroreductase family protein [Pseudomonadota bacterium]
MIARYVRSSHFYRTCRDRYHRWRKLLFFFNDATQTFRYMRWRRGGDAVYWEISSELLFNYHKLEKGLCMPGKVRFFGYEPACETVRLIKAWRGKGFSVNDPIYIGAIETLRAYRLRINDTPPRDGAGRLYQLLEREIGIGESCLALSTPMPRVQDHDNSLLESFSRLSLNRRSVRAFKSRTVPYELLERAVSLARLSPSACNRQPCVVHSYAQRDQIDSLLLLQNGNRGFGHTIPLLLVITAKSNCFFDASERHEPYVDAGLFAMSLLFALQAQGLSSCCLNWCAEPSVDADAHTRGGIPAEERIIMFIAVGYAADDAKVPRSPRRDIQTILFKH